MLGLENYPEAIRLHQRFVAQHPHDALAHYHLGFAYGMIGHTQEEIREYVAAGNLGLTNWDLFLNLGLAYLAQGNSGASIGAFEQAVLDGPVHFETHFNLAIAYEKAGRLTAALREITAASSLNSTDPEVQNMRAVIEAELGDFRIAHNEWSDLVRERPDYAPARHNLGTLDAMLFNASPTLIRFHGTNE
jgi:tetratricopeptide (TPR) repeat protein